MSESPHVPAAFINAIREEGTHAEACNSLQRQWNESCSLRAERDALRAQVERLRGVLGQIYYNVDGWNSLQISSHIRAALAEEAKP